MPPTKLHVTSRVVGARPDAPPLEPVLLELFERRVTVAQLIRLTVEEQVRQLLVNQSLAVAEAQALLDRHYADQPSQPAAPAEPYQPTALSAEREIDRARRAFTEGRYVIIVNGRQVEHLDEEIAFELDTRVTFLRLTPLVGG